MPEETMRFFMIVLILFTGVVTPLMAQEKQGKLGGFEDAAKGKSHQDADNDADYNDDSDDDAGWVGDVIEFLIDIIFDGGDDDQYTDPEPPQLQAESARDTTLVPAIPRAATMDDAVSRTAPPVFEGYGRFPFDKNGLIQNTQKKYLGQLTLSGSRYTSSLTGLHVAGHFFLSGKNGVNLDFQDFREDLRTRTDHLQVLQLSYRHLFSGAANYYWAGHLGFIGYLPDKDKSSNFGPMAGLELRYFPVKPISVYGEITLSALPAYKWASTLETKAGIGFHYKHLEFYLGFHTFTPFNDPSAGLYGPVVGVNIWF